MAKATDKRKVNAIVKYFELGMGISEIADIVELHPATVHRILGREGAKEYCEESAKRLTEKQKADILKLYNMGVVVDKIAEKVGCSRHTIYRYVGKAGMNRNISETKVKMAIEEYLNSSKKVEDICKAHGISKPTFYRRLRKYTEENC